MEVEAQKLYSNLFNSLIGVKYTQLNFSLCFLSQEACKARLYELQCEIKHFSKGGTSSHDMSEDDRSTSDFVLVIDGRTLEFALQNELQEAFLELTCCCRSVICCRSTPLQKSQVVRLVRDQLKVMTLAIGQ